MNIKKGAQLSCGLLVFVCLSLHGNFTMALNCTYEVDMCTYRMGKHILESPRCVVLGNIGAWFDS